jgi:hypothetical protein
MEFIFVIKSCTIKVPIPVTNGVAMEVPDIAIYRESLHGGQAYHVE